jgi:hypothetical protein
VLDGVDRMEAQTLLHLRRLLRDGVADLPSGERLTAHPAFRLLCLGAAPSQGSRAALQDAASRYLTSDLDLSYHLLPSLSPQDVRSILLRSGEAGGSGGQVEELLLGAAQALHRAAGSEHPELRPSLRHLLRARNTLLALQAQRDVGSPPMPTAEAGALVRGLLEQALLVRFLSAGAAGRFEAAMLEAGLPQAASTNSDASAPQVRIDAAAGTVSIGDVTARRRHAGQPELVPQPLFHENAAHLRVLRSLLLAYAAADVGAASASASALASQSQQALLLIGNQGVGKNKLVDRLLQVRL